MTEQTVNSGFWNRTNLISLGTLGLFLVLLVWWFFDRAGYVHVTDARVSATMVSVSSRIPGWVKAMPVSDGTQVKKGDVLVRIDPKDAELQLARLEAGLQTMEVELSRFDSEFELRQQQIESSIAADQARLKVAESALSESRIMLAKARRDFERSTSLLADKMVSEETHENLQALLQELEQTHQQRIAEKQVAAAELQLAKASLAELDVMKTNNAIKLSKKKELQIERDRLANTIADLTIVSPIDGVVDETFANAGEYVYPGQRILMLHDPANIWIKANVKETNIRHLQIGQAVKIDVDAYPDETFSGKVVNIGNSATSQFALLPSPNPSGNFTKITQRLEVQVALDDSYLQLRPGMMVELAIDIGAACCDKQAIADAN